MSEDMETKTGLETPEGSEGFKLICRALEWGDRERSQAIVYGMSGERVGSHFLEAVVRLASEDFLGDMGDRCFGDGQVTEYASHPVANYLVQTLLQRAPKQQAKVIIRELCEDEEGDGPGGGLAKLMKTGKAGVVWHIFGACARHSILQKKTLRALSKMAEGSKGNLVSSILQAQLPEDSEKGKLQINVPGAKIIQQLLRYETQHSESIAQEILCFPVELLAACARDNVASRCLIDPLLKEEGLNGNKGSTKLDEKIAVNLKGFYGKLAVDRVGHHCILKLYKSCSVELKEAILQEVVPMKAQLQGLAFGRKLLTTCAVESFEHRPDEWRRRLQWGDTKKDFLEEVFAVEKDIQADESLGGKRKRKRNRNRKRKQDQGGIEKDQTDTNILSTENKNVNENVDLTFVLDAIKDSTNSSQKKDKKRKQKATKSHSAGFNNDSFQQTTKVEKSQKKIKSMKSPKVNEHGQNLEVLSFAKDMTSNDVSKTNIHEMVNMLESERTAEKQQKGKSKKKGKKKVKQ
mmetsp:Transcript_25375/g.32921  ORF Transcript_25375/g.32921 Transcript_25375/m.32921 type:complete len:519 (-) Transcript_25375:67-1623(-)